uniref:Uncharacterized protein n=1 Tax=Globodera rostochiensis TaxID=31243 RepID=A0A914HRB4_GLORO
MRLFYPNKMEEFWILILLSFFATNSLEKGESVKVKLELKTFDEIFGEGWWDKGEAEDLKNLAPTNFEQNVHHQIDRQNTQIGQIEPNSTDQIGQIELNSNDQNPPHADKKLMKLSQKSWASVLKQFTLGNVNLAKPNQTINTSTANNCN